MTSRRRLLLGGTAIAALAVAGTPVALHVIAKRQPAYQPVSQDVVAWLKANAIPLATAEPGSGFQDLEFLRAVVGDARIVSLGEATHATREFFQLKHRVIEFCVAELGFTIIAFEAYYGETLAVNDYVLNGKGSAAEVAAGMGFWLWNTEEVIALVEWTRKWNLAHERKVKFYGFDMQSCVAASLHLLDYLQRVAPDLAASSEAPLGQLPPNAGSPLAGTAQGTIPAQINKILASFDTERALWISRLSELEWHLARRSAVTVEQCLRSPQVAQWLEYMTWRDRCMADNVRALLEAEGPQAKALLWAHNAHVRRTPLWAPTMGGFLHAEFAAQQVVIGFSFNQGGFRMSELPPSVNLGPAPAGFVDAALARTGLPLLALGLRRVPSSGPVAAWMASKPLQRSAGAGPRNEPRWYSIHYWYELFKLPFADAGNPRENYDVLIFVESSTPSRRNPRKFWTTVRADAVPNNEPTNLTLASAGEIPNGWHADETGLYTFDISASDERSPTGGRTVRIARAAALLPWGDGFLTQSFPAAKWRGQRLVFSAAMRAAAQQIGTGAKVRVKVVRKAGFWQQPPALLAVQLTGPVRSPQWTRRSVAVDIPADAESIEIGLVVTGNSTGWFGDLTLEAAGPGGAS